MTWADEPATSGETGQARSAQSRARELKEKIRALRQRLEALKAAPAAPPAPEAPAEPQPGGPSGGELRDGNVKGPPQPRKRASDQPSPAKVRELERRAGVLESLVVGRGYTRGLLERGPGWNEKSGFFLQSNDGNFFMKFTGFVQAEYRAFPGGQTGLEPGTDPDTFDVRRLRPQIDVRVFRQFHLQIAPDFAPRRRSELFNAFVEWDYYNWARARVGQFKPNVSIEMTQSEADLIFMERSLVQNLNPYRDFGVQITGRLLRQTLRYDIGVLNGSAAGPSNVPDLAFSNGKRLMARLMVAPFAAGDSDALRELDVGLGFTNESTRQQTGQQPMLTEAQDRIIFQYGPNVTGDGDTTRFVPYLRYFYGRVGVMSVFTRVLTHQKNLATNAEANLHHEAWMVQGTFLLTDDHATFDRVDPKRPFDLSKPGHWGAFELAARYAELRIDPAAFALGMANPQNNVMKTKALSLGLNWYLSHPIKMQVHWEHNDFDGAGPAYTASGTSNALLYRITLVY